MDHAGLSRWARRQPVRFARSVAGGLGVVVALAAAAAPAPPGAPITRFSGDLFGVSAASPSAAWAVGETELHHQSATVLLHWNGRSWTRAASPMPGSLSAASALSAGNAWAVGQFDTSTTLETLVLHWNGTSWTRVPSPSPGPAPVGDNLAGVSALSPSNAWAVGDEDTFGPPGPVFKTLVLHWNGTKWALVASPNPSPQFDSLTSVSAVSPSDAWAVGVAGKGSNNTQALALHWNGRAWVPVPTPSPPGSRLTGVSALSPRDAWAVGETVTRAGVHKTLVLHWNGTTWALVPSPSPSPSDSGLAGVSALSPCDVWAAGVTLDSRGNRHTLILRWNGTNWTRMPSPNPAGLLGSNLIAMSARAADDVWATGNVLERGTDQTLILHWNGTRWTRS
jgi:hypothetical protein